MYKLLLILFFNIALAMSLQDLEGLGKLGVYGININAKYNENIRFPICSAYKFLLVGASLEYNMRNKGFLDKKILIPKFNIKEIGYSPITSKNIGKYLSIHELNQASILSDNFASNLLLKELGGLDYFNNFIQHTLNDKITIIADNEPNINQIEIDSKKNTTTPKAIAVDMYLLAFSNILDTKHKKLFITYLQNNDTGKNRIALNMPKSYKIGDKTGTCGSFGAINDIAIIFPNNNKPFILSIFYLDQNNKNIPNNEKIISNATKILLDKNTP